MPIDYTGFKFGKKRRQAEAASPPAPRARLQRRTPMPRGRRNAEAHNAVVTRVRAEVFALDLVCGVCGKPPHQNDEMHEVTSRAKTRGMPPEERFNRRICVRLHRTCHADVTENRMKLAYLDPVRGVDGGLVSQARGSDEAVVYRRGTQPSHTRLGAGTVQRGIWTPRGDVGGPHPGAVQQGGAVGEPLRDARGGVERRGGAAARVRDRHRPRTPPV